MDRGVESNYNFLHLSLQEYLAAWHISHLSGAKQKDIFLNARNLQFPDLSVVRGFLAGITGFRDAIWQDIQFYPETGELTGDMCTCLYETQNHIHVYLHTHT